MRYITGRSSVRKIGKTVFFTQSEAEEALQKMNEREEN